MTAPRTVVRVTAIAAVALVSTAVITSAAGAATLPPDQTITLASPGNSQFYTANPADAFLTPVGAPNTMIPYVLGVDVDDTGMGYAVATDLLAFDDEVDEGPRGGYLYTADAVAGTLSDPTLVSVDLGAGPQFVTGCTAIDYSVGVVMVSCYIVTGIGPARTIVNYLGVVDTETGIIADPTTFDISNTQDNRQTMVDAIARDPISGLLYLYTSPFPSGLGYGSYSWSAITGFDYIGNTTSRVYGADFDSSGLLWGTSVGAGLRQGVLATLDQSDATFESFDGMTRDGGVVFRIDAITVWGAAPTPLVPVLPATGSTMAFEVTAVAAVLVLLGGALVARRRSYGKKSATP